MNERIDEHFRGLLTKLLFSTNDITDVLKNIFSHKETLVWNRDFL